MFNKFQWNVNASGLIELKCIPSAIWMYTCHTNSSWTIFHFSVQILGSRKVLESVRMWKSWRDIFHLFLVHLDIKSISISMDNEVIAIFSINLFHVTCKRVGSRMIISKEEMQKLWWIHQLKCFTYSIEMQIKTLAERSGGYRPQQRLNIYCEEAKRWQHICLPKSIKSRQHILR